MKDEIKENMKTVIKISQAAHTGRPDRRLAGRAFPDFFDHARTVFQMYVPQKI